MYYEAVKSGRHVCHLLRESYREGAKVRHRTIANLSRCTAEEIEAVRLALAHKAELAAILSRPAAAEAGAERPVAVRQGPSGGAVWVLAEVAGRLGIRAALGDGAEGRLALWQVVARALAQGSRLSAVRLAQAHAAGPLLGLPELNEHGLYRNLDWLHRHQAAIERRLWAGRAQAAGAAGLFLYDVTSSYLEGTHNELAAFGYNRDGKRGKRQVVIGLLCDGAGRPVSIEVFAGHTADSATFGAQLRKARERFGVTAVTWVGDRGMIKSGQVAEVLGQGGHYITAITKAQIRTLLAQGVIQLGLFDQALAEVTAGGVRYILRSNPVRAAEVKAVREDKLAALARRTDQAAAWLTAHPRASGEKALARLENWSRRLKTTDYVRFELAGRSVRRHIDRPALAAAGQLDGCYVLRTNLPAERVGKETVHDRYRDLAQVEQAFRTSKTAHLEMRPIYVRLEDRTRGHALVVMLAYDIVRELSRCWAGLDCTVAEGLAELSSLTLDELVVNGRPVGQRLAEPRESVRRLLEAADVRLPTAFRPAAPVSTKRKLPSRRKSRK